MYPVRWRDHDQDDLGLLGEIFRSRSRAVPFLAEQWLIGQAARSLATYAGPPRARNATLAVALSGSICPSSKPLPLPDARLWPGLCRLIRGVVDLWFARRQRRCEIVHVVSRVKLDSRSYISTRSIYSSTPDLPRHATMRSEAFQRPSHCCPRKHSTHAWAGRVWQGPLFDELPQRLMGSYLTRPLSLAA